jgi:hypothetical protein
MTMDLRLTSVEKLILITIALHYNLRDGRCDPAHGRVAVEAGLGSGETGTKAVQRAVARAVELGWLERTCRRGGPREKNQTNLYELTLPKPIRDTLKWIRATGQIEGGDRTIDPPRTGKYRTGYISKIAPVADAPVAKGKLESEGVPVAPFHRKSTSLEEAIARAESIIAPEVPHEK